MKHASLCLCLCGVLLIQSNVFAQQSDYSYWSAGVRLGLNRAEYVGGILSKEGFGFAFGAEVERTFNPLWGLAAAYDYLGYSYGSVNGSAHELTGLASLNFANLVHRYRKGDWQKLNVYGRLGAGFSLFSAAISAKTVVIPMGASIEYDITPNLAINVTGDRRWHMSNSMGLAKTFQDKAVYWAGTVGLRFKFGNASRPHIRNTSITDYESPYMQFFYHAVPVQGVPEPVPVAEPESVEVEEIGVVVEPAEPEVKIIETDEVAPKTASAEPEVEKTSDTYVPALTFKAIVEYELEKYEFPSSSQRSLDELAATLKEYPNVKIEVVGHTDDSGPESFNKELSLKRADIVKNYLVKKGIDAARITTKGMAAAQSVASNTTLEGRRKNRRVEVLFSSIE
ncbi:MAG: OmpA family protein [Prevotellaceae bacterium]|jgi:outer membrane protein OmpA-like peptidoglycan-associated protein/opacity protein-like surface antigen|nr:OmpA family protein [Prevotellaceae bacterium]